MLRRLISLILMIAFFGAAQASAAAAPPCATTQMSAADCMAMMDRAKSEDAGGGPTRGCTPADCMNFMIGCSGLTALPASLETLTVAVLDRSLNRQQSIQNPMIGRTPPPDIRPPIV